MVRYYARRTTVHNAYRLGPRFMRYPRFAQSAGDGRHRVAARVKM